MGRFVETSIERVSLGGGDFVDLRLPITYGVRRKIADALFGLKFVDGKPEGGMQLAASNLALLLAVIAAWGGPGFEDKAGKVRAITAENIDAMDDTAEVILEEIERRTEKPTPDFTKRRSRSKGTARPGRRKSASA